MFIKNILSSLRNAEFYIPGALTLFGLGAWAGMFTGAQELLRLHSDVLLTFSNYMCCLVGAILVGYTGVVGMMNGPNKNDNVTVQTQENMAETETVKKRYLKI